MLYPTVNIQYDDANITDSFLQSLKALFNLCARLISIEDNVRINLCRI